MTLEVDDKIGFLDRNGIRQSGYVTQISSSGRQAVVEHKHSETLHILTWDADREAWAEG